MKHEQKVAFLQQAYQKLPVGTPLVRAEPTPAHLQAKAMLGGTAYPASYYKVFGGGDEVFYIPMFEGLVGEYHPLAKEVIGPFSLDPDIRVDYDKLPAGKRARISYQKQWPVIKVTVCLDPDQKDLDFDIDEWDTANPTGSNWPDCIIGIEWEGTPADNVISEVLRIAVEG